MKRFLTVTPREGSACGPDDSAKQNIPPKKKFDDATYDREKRKRTFQDHWVAEFPWLCYDETTGKMACTTCQKHPQIADLKSTLVIGTDNIRKDPLYKHLKSTSHLACVSRQSKLDSKGNSTATTSTPIGRGILALHEKHRQRLNMLFNTAYGLAKKSRPFTDFETVCRIQIKNSMELGDNYINNKAVQQFTSCIAKMVTQLTSTDMQKARFLTVMSDRSTDTTIVEQEVIYVRYVRQGNPITKLASIQALEHGHAEGVHQGVMQGLARIGLNEKNLLPEESSTPTLVSANFDGAHTSPTSISMAHTSPLCCS